MLGKNDRRILAELQRDSRLTMQELADRVGMSSSAVWRKVKSLEESGVIDRYAAIVNAKKAGFGLASMVHVSLARHEQIACRAFRSRSATPSRGTRMFRDQRRSGFSSARRCRRHRRLQ